MSDLDYIRDAISRETGVPATLLVGSTEGEIQRAADVALAWRYGTDGPDCAAAQSGPEITRDEVARMTATERLQALRQGRLAHLHRSTPADQMTEVMQRLCHCLEDIPVMWPIFEGQVGVHRSMVTAEIAEHWLTHASRPATDLIPELVESYSRLMSSGGWVDQGSKPILFSEGGVLLDGHHRLHSVVRSGCATALPVYRQAC